LSSRETTDEPKSNPGNGNSNWFSFYAGDWIQEEAMDEMF